MAESRHTTVTKHIVAMQLILMMQKGASFPNIEYVAANPIRVVPEDPGAIKDGLNLLQDLMMLIDGDVYTAFHAILNEGLPNQGQLLDGPYLQLGLQHASDVVQLVSAFARVPMWSGGDDHPCPPIMREVVISLLR